MVLALGTVAPLLAFTENKQDSARFSDSDSMRGLYAFRTASLADTRGDNITQVTPGHEVTGAEDTCPLQPLWQRTLFSRRQGK